MKVNIDFRLLEARLDVDILGIHLDLIERQIRESREEAKHQLKAAEYSSDYDYADWLVLEQELRWKTDFALPRILYNSFLVSLFTVYETVTTEIAHNLQRKYRIDSSLDEVAEHSFLDRAKEYYHRVLLFDLWATNRGWMRLKDLAYLRNAFAHANGRIEMIQSRGFKIKKIKGVDHRYGYILVRGSFVRETFSMVTAELEGLITRYREWDSARRVPQDTDRNNSGLE